MKARILASSHGAAAARVVSKVAKMLEATEAASKNPITVVVVRWIAIWKTTISALVGHKPADRDAAPRIANKKYSLLFCLSTDVSAVLIFLCDGKPWTGFT